MSDVLSARNLRKRFVDGDRELGVLNGIDVDVKAGERIAVVGRSGSGKSTLLHILAGLTEPDVGEVSVVGQSMTSASSDGRAAIRNHHMGFVYQFHHLLPEFSALENVAMPLIISGRSSLESEERAMNLLSAVDLAERLGHRPHQLSGGERQRVAVARAMATEPDILLADEPTGNLDRESASQVLMLMGDMSVVTGTAFIVVTHDASIADKMNRSFVLEDGKLNVQPRAH
ncbi:MAG: ATP-binding cassette domain-containing protein [Pseudomonadota bacterium]|nr:ATP-binding cassette domain-containing protein [Pseudomonadota bacterium]|tara:strand:+ start:7698 stop:8387 length:690 start_codon:yes stop_codon:yes gene_type:complete